MRGYVCVMVMIGEGRVTGCLEENRRTKMMMRKMKMKMRMRGKMVKAYVMRVSIVFEKVQEEMEQAE